MGWPANFLVLLVIAVLSYVAGRAHQCEIDTRPLPAARRARLPLAVVLDRGASKRLEIPTAWRVRR